MNAPLDTINAIFREHNIACSVIALEVDCHKLKRAQRRMICNQLKHDLPEHIITFSPNRYRVTLRPTHRAEVA